MGRLHPLRFLYGLHIGMEAALGSPVSQNLVQVKRICVALCWLKGRQRFTHRS